MQVIFIVAFLGLKNLSLVATEIGKHAEWSWEGSKEPPAEVQQLISVPFAVEKLWLYYQIEFLTSLTIIQTPIFTEGERGWRLKIVINQLPKLHQG